MHPRPRRGQAAPQPGTHLPILTLGLLAGDAGVAADREGHRGRHARPPAPTESRCSLSLSTILNVGCQAPATSRPSPAARPISRTPNGSPNSSSTPLVRPSFVSPAPMRQLRDLTRYRTEVIRGRTREIQRLQEAARRRRHQAVLGRHRHARGIGAGDAAGPDRR
jgi:hypothetical protein